MDKRKKLLTYMAAARMLLSIMAMVIHHSKKRKRQAPRERIRYGPIDERDRIRLEYLENKI